MDCVGWDREEWGIAAGVLAARPERAIDTGKPWAGSRVWEGEIRTSILGVEHLMEAEGESGVREAVQAAGIKWDLRTKWDYPRDQVPGLSARELPQEEEEELMKGTVRQEHGAPEAIWEGSVSRRNGNQLYQMLLRHPGKLGEEICVCAGTHMHNERWTEVRTQETWQNIN